MPEEEKRRGKNLVPFMKVSRFKELLQLFSREFPEVFACKETKLLKVGIHLDIAKKLDLEITEIKGFLRMYCTGGKYLEAHTQGAKRYDLDGNEIEEVTEDQIAFVQKVLVKRAKKKQAQKQEKEIKKAS